MLHSSHCELMIAHLISKKILRFINVRQEKNLSQKEGKGKIRN